MNKNTLILIAVAAVAIYLWMKKPKAVTPAITKPLNGVQPAQSNSPLGAYSDLLARYTKQGQTATKSLSDGTTSAAALVKSGTDAFGSLSKTFSGWFGSTPSTSDAGSNSSTGTFDIPDYNFDVNTDVSYEG